MDKQEKDELLKDLKIKLEAAIALDEELGKDRPVNRYRHWHKNKVIYENYRYHQVTLIDIGTLIGMSVEAIRSAVVKERYRQQLAKKLNLNYEDCFRTEEFSHLIYFEKKEAEKLKNEKAVEKLRKHGNNDAI